MSETDETRQNTTQTAAETADQTPAREEAESTPVAPPAERPRHRGSIVPLIISLIAVLLVGGGLGAGYWGWQQLRQQSATNNQSIDNLNTQLKALQVNIGAQASQHAVDALQKQLAALEQQVKSQTQTLDTLNRAVERGRTLAQRNQRGWSLAEVEYLMRIARYRLDLMHDYPGSIAALKAADQQLAALADPNLLPVRQALAKEIGDLRDFKKPDRVGIMLELAQLGDHLKGLPPAQPALGGKSVETAHANPRSGWRGLLDSVWASISKHITIRHYDQPVQSAPGAESLLYMNQVLRLRLEAARVAVMRGNNTDYHSELKAALDWLDAHYAPQAAASTRQQLQSLQARDIAPTPPDISASLTLLHRLAAGGETQSKGTSS
ncbi:MAG: uroporphyrinogen-III C-methyltransferase [Acidihalobacter sp.]|uniref:uroporphyrinogen-III C-methyltransferase n=1 Tax=Acidihalobacter sp. TaxID=1872108 RepID=UPI00307E85CE